MATCVKCGVKASNPVRVDVPPDIVLCEDCFKEYVWTCDSCGRDIALPDVEGGESQGYTPLLYENWCQECCSAKLASCEECGCEELVADMGLIQDSLLCEQCFAGHRPTANDSPVLTRENWKQAILTAIEELPDDIRSSVGYYDRGDNCRVIRVACEPMEEGESSMNEVKVTWWDTRRNELESYIQQSPGCGLEESIEFESDKGSIDKPSISIESDVASEPIWSLCPGVGTVEFLKSTIQVAILNELFEGGGFSMVCKDSKGRFVRDDGTYILDRQRPKLR